MKTYGLIVIPFLAGALAFSAGRYIGRQEGTFTFQQHPPEAPYLKWNSLDKRLAPCAIKITADQWNRIGFGGATIHGSVVIENADHVTLDHVTVTDADIGVFIRQSEKAESALVVGSGTENW